MYSACSGLQAATRSTCVAGSRSSTNQLLAFTSLRSACPAATRSGLISTEPANDRLTSLSSVISSARALLGVEAGGLPPPPERPAPGGAGAPPAGGGAAPPPPRPAHPAPDAPR